MAAGGFFWKSSKTCSVTQMTKFSYQFTHAVVRRPSRSIANGLRATDMGDPDLDLFAEHHRAYVDLLKAAGANVIELEPLDDYPDSVFVEDTALCLPQGAVIMRPGAPSRLGEASIMAATLDGLYGSTRTIEAPGFIEGGDVLTTEHEILVGRSERTNSAGIEMLSKLVAPWGYRVREVATPAGVLHFKTDCSLLDERTILSTARLAQTECFSDYEVVLTEPGEEACANAIRFNSIVIMPAGFPRTEAKLKSRGYSVKTVGNTEAAKLDGGMSCLSLRFSPAHAG